MRPKRIIETGAEAAVLRKGTVGEPPSPLSPMKPFPFLILAATALAVLMTDARRGKLQTLPRKGRGNFEAGDTLADPVLSVEAGEEVEIPCQLQGPKLTWYWIPRYPICAGFSDRGKKEIFSTSSVGEDQVLLERFQSRAEKQGEKGERNLVLVLKSLYMNDSGTFYCSNGNRNSSKISVSVEPDKENGIRVRPSTTPPGHHDSVTLSCKPCKDQRGDKSDGNTKITWTQNGLPVSNNSADIRVKRNAITIERFSSRYYGLWNCSHPACQNGYCLEGNLENPHLEGECRVWQRLVGILATINGPSSSISVHSKVSSNSII
ncbi:megakaryocyte and platelet inhibitory receptor G6b [Podarcis muralis]